MMKIRSLFCLIFLLNLFACIEKKITKNDKTILVTASDILDFYEFDIKNHQLKGKFSKRNILGSIEMTYEFESDENDDYLYILHTISKETSSSDARDSYSWDVTLQDWFKEKGTKLIEQPGFFNYGDESKFYLVEYEGTLTGNYYLFRKDTYVYSLLIYGLYFVDSEEWEEFISPKLESFEKYLKYQSN